jgi:hypothetical protein
MVDETHAQQTVTYTLVICAQGKSASQHELLRRYNHARAEATVLAHVVVDETAEEFPLFINVLQDMLKRLVSSAGTAVESLGLGW